MNYPLLQQLIDASTRDQPALTVELARLHLIENPDERPALMMYGGALVELARYAEARAVYEHALAVSPADKRAHVLCRLGELCDARYEAREAERYYREAIVTAPAHASAYIYLGGLLAKTGRLEEAETSHRRATQSTVGEIDEAYLNL